MGRVPVSIESLMVYISSLPDTPLPSTHACARTLGRDRETEKDREDISPLGISQQLPSNSNCVSQQRLEELEARNALW